MRPLALLMIGLIVYLSCFPGAGKAAMTSVDKGGCCKKMRVACHHQPKENKPSSDDCGQSGCAAMFSCSLCGFVINMPLTIQSVFGLSFVKPVTQYIQGQLRDYQPDNWKPPRVC